jgi:hypothetical protein
MTALIILFIITTVVALGFAILHMVHDRLQDSSYFLMIAVTAIIAATTLTFIKSSSDEKAAVKKAAAEYDLELIKTSDEGFVATNSDGMTVKCSFTKDDAHLVCNGELLQK